MSFDGFPHDSFYGPLFFRPTLRPVLYQSHFCSHLRSPHESKTTASFTTSTRVPFVPSVKAPRISSIKAPRILSIKAPAIPHRVIPGTTRYTSSGGDQEKKQTGSAWLNSRDEYPTSRNGVQLPVHHDESSLALGPRLQVRQEFESVSNPEGHCGRVICSPRYLTGSPSQGCTTDLLGTEYTISSPGWHLVLDTDGSKRRSVDDSTTKGTTSAATPVAHVARAAQVPSSLGFRESGNGLSVSSDCTGSSYAGVSTIATDGK